MENVKKISGKRFGEDYRRTKKNTLGFLPKYFNKVWQNPGAISDRPAEYITSELQHVFWKNLIKTSPENMPDTVRNKN